LNTESVFKIKWVWVHKFEFIMKNIFEIDFWIDNSKMFYQASSAC